MLQSLAELAELAERHEEECGWRLLATPMHRCAGPQEVLHDMRCDGAAHVRASTYERSLSRL
jgi:hypothetical protein